MVGDCRPAVLNIVALFRPQCEHDMDTMFLDSQWSSTIILKGQEAFYTMGSFTH